MKSFGEGIGLFHVRWRFSKKMTLFDQLILWSTVCTLYMFSFCYMDDGRTPYGAPL